MMRGHLDKPIARRAVITGAASGLGRALALELAGKGWWVGVADFNDDGARETLTMVERAGGSGESFHCDVRSEDDVAAMAERVFSGGAVGLLVNNAGVVAGGLVGDIPMEDWSRILDTNLLGVIHGCQAFIPPMREQDGGHILNIGSSAGLANLPEMASYNVAKAGVISLSETLRAELAPHRIGVTVGCPSFFDTNLLSCMTCTDQFQSEFAHSAFANAKVTADEVARMLLKGVDRNRPYVFPQRSAKFVWAAKRFSPRLFHGVISLACRLGVQRSLIMGASRRGLV